MDKEDKPEDKYMAGWVIYETVGFAAINVEAVPLCPICNKRTEKYYVEKELREYWACVDCNFWSLITK